MLCGFLYTIQTKMVGRQNTFLYVYIMVTTNKNISKTSRIIITQTFVYM